MVKELLDYADIGAELAMEIGREARAHQRQRPHTGTRRLDPSVEHLAEPLRARHECDVVRHDTIPSALQFPRVVFMRPDDKSACDGEDAVPLPSPQPLSLVQEEWTRLGNSRPRAIFRQVDVRRAGQRAAKCEKVCGFAAPLVPEELNGRSATVKLLEIHRNIDDRELRPLLASQLTKRIAEQVPAKIR
jgi:hypothetical protein